jgi:hypothetical protein
MTVEEWRDFVRKHSKGELTMESEGTTECVDMENERINFKRKQELAKEAVNLACQFENAINDHQERYLLRRMFNALID